MRATKHSGVDWLGEIPSDWQVKRFRHVFRESDEVNGREPVGPMLSISSYHGVQVKEYASESLQRDKDQLETYRVVRPNQLAVNTMWLNHGGLGVSEITGHMSPAYRAYWIGGGFDPKFLHHLMRSKIYVVGYTGLLTGIRPNSLQMSRENLMGFPILCPPIDEQRRIADFLDRETAKIDALIAKQEQLITTLDERKQAAVAQVLSLGLRNEVSLKESGVKWLGKVPSHWDVVPIKWLTSVRRGSSPRPIDDPRYFDENGEWAWVRISDVTASKGLLRQTRETLSELGSSLSTKILPGELFVSIAGTVGMPAIADIKCCIHDGFVYFPTLTLNRKYLYRILESGRCFGGLGKLGTQLNLNTDTIGNIRVPIPPPRELDEIVEFIDAEVEKANALVARVQTAVALLLERRQALISAAVTGKLEVSDGYS